MKGLMEAQEPEMEREDDESPESLDSQILFNSALAFLGTPEGTDGIVKTMQGARDVGTAVGKMAAMVIARIKKELEGVGLQLTEGGIYNADGGLTRVLAVIYTLAKANGVNVNMQDTFAQAFEVAEADLQKMEQMPAGGPPAPEQPQGLMAPQPPMGAMPNAPVS